MLKAFVRNFDSINNSSLQGVSCLTKSTEMAIQDSTHKLLNSIPAFIKIAEAVPEKSSLLPRSFDVDDSEVEEMLQGASINFNWLLRHGMSSTVLRKKICNDKNDPSVSMVFLRPPQMSLLTSAKFYTNICNPNITHHLVQLLNQSYIKSKVQEIQEKEFFSGQWLQELMGSSDVLIDVGTHLISSLTEIQIHNVFDVFSYSQDLMSSKIYMKGSSLIETLHADIGWTAGFQISDKIDELQFTYKIKDVFREAAVDVRE
ncbi:ATP-binding cassette sub-family A member 1 [Caerostris extrusa]|uniref:ATP-binding cassette sub-family A member 1 n=1 Tax=Caerostris extrusa TaxID=172846 RepID=A0AAV4TYF3_CAEEX|nr:ATP-binding cassette sub-family A member 1 [Caerostris extrusa]